MADRICEMTGCGKAHRARGLCSTHYNLRHLADRHPRVIKPCVMCGARVMRPKTSRHDPTCSVACRTALQWGQGSPVSAYDWALDAMARARKHGAPLIEWVDRNVVFERDGHCCTMCELPVSTPSPYRLDSATVDHIVPLSLGGSHVLSNVRTACLLCNSTRGTAAA